LNVEAEACVGSRALPTILNFSINLFEVIITIGLKLDVLLSQTVVFEAEYTNNLECICINLCSLFEGVREFSSPYP
jgi:hypothetical protein